MVEALSSPGFTRDFRQRIEGGNEGSEMKCFCCGADKDLSIESVYPYADDSLSTEIPLPQLLTIECQGKTNNPDGSWDFRMAIMCHDCWHRLEQKVGIDMWIGQTCWEALGPQVPFSGLPVAKDDTIGQRDWDASHYESWPWMGG